MVLPIPRSSSGQAAPSRFSPHKRFLFRLRSAGFEAFHRVHRDYYLFLLFYLLLTTCKRVYVFGAARREASVCVWGSKTRGQCMCLGQLDSPDSRANVENSGAGSSGLVHQNGRPQSAREQPELPGRDGRWRWSKLKHPCRRRVVEAGPRDLDLLQLAQGFCSE